MERERHGRPDGGTTGNCQGTKVFGNKQFHYLLNILLETLSYLYHGKANTSGKSPANGRSRSRPNVRMVFMRQIGQPTLVQWRSPGDGLGAENFRSRGKPESSHVHLQNDTKPAFLRRLPSPALTGG